MAGIGFQLKRLFDKEGLIGRMQAITYASLVTVGPILCCMLAVVSIHLLLVSAEAPYYPREVFQAATSYAFAGSFIVTAPVSMFLTRCVSDLLYQKRYEEMLPSFYGCLQLLLPAGSLPAIVFLLFAKLTIGVKLGLFILYMLLIVLWIEVVFVSAMKAYRRVALAFACGMGVSVAGTWFMVKFTQESISAASLIIMLAIGFFITTAGLLWEIERFFRMPGMKKSLQFVKELRRYSSLAIIGLCTGLAMYEHQFAQWFYHGVWLEESFRLKPEYDVAVYFAVISVIPTLVWFVVSVETAFYPKFRQYYDAILGQGTINDIDRARREMEQVLLGEMSRLMGIQLVFSIVAVALGIRFLPYIGFTAQQVDTFNILVMSFYVYIMFTVVLLLILYFDDRKGALILATAFLAANVVFSVVLRSEEFQGLSLFIASFPALIAAIARLVYRLRHLHYATFSAQPLFDREPKGVRKGINTNRP